MNSIKHSVAIVTPHYPPPFNSGGLKSVSLIAENLISNPRIGSVRIFCFDGNSKETVSEVPVTRLGNLPPQPVEPINIYAYYKLKSRLRGFDVIHSYNTVLHPTVGRLSEDIGIPSTASLNSYVILPKSVTGIPSGNKRLFYEKTLLRITYRTLISNMNKIDKIFKMSDSIGNIYSDVGIDSRKLVKIPNILDPEFETNKFNSKNNGELISVLYVGELRKSKGVSDLVSSMKFLSDKFTLEIYGSGPEEYNLKHQAKRQSVDTQINFHGKVSYERVKSAYANADIFVHPGIWPEPFNRTLLEAMQSELPVVVTDIGGPPEVIPQDDLVCPPKNPRKLAETVKLSLDMNDPGKENKDYVQRYNPKVVINDIIDQYEMLI